MPNPNPIPLSKADALRVQAMELLSQAQALDGKLFYNIVHAHEFGITTYMMLAKGEPTQAQATAVLDSAYEPELGESLSIDSFNAHQLFGIKDPTFAEVAG